MNESELQRVYKYNKYPQTSKYYSDKGLVNKNNGSQGGTHWTCFIMKANTTFYFHTFGGAADDFLLNQLPKPITYQTYKYQGINSRLCCS